MFQPVRVLVRPQLGVKIGAEARAMRNFGIERFWLVASRDSWPNPAAAALALGAGRLLDEAWVHETLAEALADATAVIASTARSREFSKPVLDSERVTELAADCCGEGERVAILFGLKRAGLENRDIAHAHANVSVPTYPDFFSLNLAKYVLLVCCDFRRFQKVGGMIAYDELVAHVRDVEGYQFRRPSRSGLGDRHAKRGCAMPLRVVESDALEAVMRACRCDLRNAKWLERAKPEATGDVAMGL